MLYSTDIGGQAEGDQHSGMFLKSLDINGFKSFPDKTHIDFSDGITSLLGPNGCGKSNIVDSIKWVLGEQSTKTLRAGKMEDVIFNGTDSRKPMQYAEVALTIDNSEHKLQTDLAEIEIKRRAFRTGEGNEYYINRQRCLLKNIRELFFDTGIGKSAYSILEQGKIDQILSSKPEDRRYIFEEAAGISRFKVECNEAQRKIDRTNENIVQVENILAGERRTYNTLKNQAEKAISYNNLVKEQLELDVKLQALKIQTFSNLKQVRSEQRASHERQLAGLTGNMDSYSAGIEEAQEGVRTLNARSYEIQNAINKAEAAITTRSERVRILEAQYHDYLTSQSEYKDKLESYASMIERDRKELEESEDSMQRKQDSLDEVERQLKRANAMIAEDKERIEALNAQIAKDEEAILHSEERIQALGEELKTVIENLALELDEKMGSEYSTARRQGCEDAFQEKLESIRRRIGDKAGFYRGLPAETDIRELVASDFTQIVQDLDALRTLFSSYKATVPDFIDNLLAPQGLLTQKRTITEEEEALRAEIARCRSRIAASRQEAATLGEEMDGLRDTAKSMEVNLASIQEGLRSASQIVQTIRRNIEQNTAAREDAEAQYYHIQSRIGQLNDQMRQADEEKKELGEDIASLRQELAQVQEETRGRNELLVQRQKERDEAVSLTYSLRSEIEKLSLWESQADEQIKNCFEYFFNTYARSLNEYKEVLEADDLPDQKLVENELEEVRKKIAALGPNINHMAVDDFKEAEERYGFLNRQLDDLNKAKADLEKVLEEIQHKSEDLFMKTYKQISDNFQNMFKRLFNGGRAEITLTDDETILTSGIEIFAQPPGKKLINLSLLSGGERSMTAVALLFATYLVKPSPFCILDEIDAALDDKNIGYFLAVLQDFSQTSQFIIITHNTHTVMGSSSLLGVTQMEAGVSTTVTYKLASIAGEPVILDENEERVDFDKDGKRKSKA